MEAYLSSHNLAVAGMATAALACKAGQRFLERGLGKTFLIIEMTTVYIPFSADNSLPFFRALFTYQAYIQTWGPYLHTNRPKTGGLTYIQIPGPYLHTQTRALFTYKTGGLTYIPSIYYVRLKQNSRKHFITEAILGLYRRVGGNPRGENWDIFIHDLMSRWNPRDDRRFRQLDFD